MNDEPKQRDFCFTCGLFFFDEYSRGLPKIFARIKTSLEEKGASFDISNEDTWKSFVDSTVKGISKFIRGVGTFDIRNIHSYLEADRVLADVIIKPLVFLGHNFIPSTAWLKAFKVEDANYVMEYTNLYSKFLNIPRPEQHARVQQRGATTAGGGAPGVGGVVSSSSPASSPAGKSPQCNAKKNKAEEYRQVLELYGEEALQSYKAEPLEWDEMQAMAGSGLVGLPIGYDAAHHAPMCYSSTADDDRMDHALEAATIPLSSSSTAVSEPPCRDAGCGVGAGDGGDGPSVPGGPPPPPGTSGAARAVVVRRRRELVLRAAAIAAVGAVQSGGGSGGGGGGGGGWCVTGSGDEAASVAPPGGPPPPAEGGSLAPPPSEAADRTTAAFHSGASAAEWLGVDADVPGVCVGAVTGAGCGGRGEAVPPPDVHARSEASGHPVPMQLGKEAGSSGGGGGGGGGSGFDIYGLD